MSGASQKRPPGRIASAFGALNDNRCEGGNNEVRPALPIYFLRPDLR
jgi:hypothetical protein